MHFPLNLLLTLPRHVANILNSEDWPFAVMMGTSVAFFLLVLNSLKEDLEGDPWKTSEEIPSISWKKTSDRDSMRLNGHSDATVLTAFACHPFSDNGQLAPFLSIDLINEQFLARIKGSKFSHGEGSCIVVI